MKNENTTLETNLIYVHAINYCRRFCLTIHKKSGKHKAYSWYKAYQFAHYNRSLSTLDNEQMDLLHECVIVLLQADWMTTKTTTKAVYKALNNAYYKTYTPPVEKRTDAQRVRHDKAVKKVLSQRLNSAQRQALKAQLNESLIDIATPTQCKAIIAVLSDKCTRQDEQSLRRLGYKLDIPNIQPPTPQQPTPQQPKPHNLLCVRPVLTTMYGDYNLVKARSVGYVATTETNICPMQTKRHSKKIYTDFDRYVMKYFDDTSK